MLRLEMPPTSLRGNTRSHWAQKHRDFRRVKDQAYAEVLVANAMGLGWRRAETRAMFVFSDRRGMANDPDNLAFSLKAVWDGAKSAGLIQDDNLLVHMPIERCVGKEEIVEVKITRLD
jgi:hypothetical protein